MTPLERTQATLALRCRAALDDVAVWERPR